MTDQDEVLRLSYAGFYYEFHGFDNPFVALRVVADYLTEGRAAGAEQPDAETLRDCVQSVVAERVTVRAERGHILLRAEQSMVSDDVAPPEAHAAAPSDNLFRDDFAASSAPAKMDEQRSDAPPAPQMNSSRGRVTTVDRAALQIALEQAMAAGEMEECDVTDAPPVEPRAPDAKATPEIQAASESTASPKPIAQRGKASNVATLSEADFSRMMAQVDQHMQEPEAATRRSAFSHLRAAVAARFADQTIDARPGREETVKAYRGDLADAMSPAHPRDLPDRTAPRAPVLELTAEHRVDVAQGVSSVLAPPAAHPEAAPPPSFVEFTKEMDGSALPEFMEAAAAYLSFIEGRAHFSRTQLMQQVQPRDFSREEGLRAFGTLLRTQKIGKLSAGQFTASTTNDFHPNRAGNPQPATS